MRFFEYGEREVSYLKRKDKRLAAVIDSVGHLDMPMDGDLYSSLVRNVIGQQISIPLYERMWARFREAYGDVPDPKKVIAGGADKLRELGMTARKAEYILGLSEGAIGGTVDRSAVDEMDDEEAFRFLDSLRGIGPWTAEMAMLFCLGRKDVFSYGDLALIRGIRMLYGVKKVSKAYFERLRKRFSPYGSVASFYIWEVGEGRVPGYEDPASKEKRKRRSTALSVID